MTWKKALALLVAIPIGLVALLLLYGLIAYPPQYVVRVLAWQDSDAFDWQKFPSHPLRAAPEPFHLDVAPDPRVPELFAQLAGTDDWQAYLQENNTQAFLVIQDGVVLYEGYFNDTQRDSIVTSFSVAKSFTSALIGLAIHEGYIGSVDDPITDYLPELAARDPRFAEITVRHLLLMASGLEYQDFRPLLFNSDDTLTTYYPDQRYISLQNTHISAPPGAYFQYNKYHPQLLGMILERTTGVTVTEYLQTRIWDRIGTEFDGSWSTDSEASDFEKMETGVNARAIDFARFGLLFLNEGSWQGDQVVPRDWVVESTAPVFPSDYDAYYPEVFHRMPGRAYYRYMWWGNAREGSLYDFSAQGDKGQYIYVSPHKNLVIVRNGTDYGDAYWTGLFYDFATQF
jgi:CubicO group peptidase (beta-lactamase class C family)